MIGNVVTAKGTIANTILRVKLRGKGHEEAELECGGLA